MLLAALRGAKAAYPHITYNVVLAYMPAEKEEYSYIDLMKTMYPEGLESVPRRFAISWRNDWMLKQSDIVVCYVRHSFDDSGKFVEKATSPEKTSNQSGRKPITPKWRIIMIINQNESGIVFKDDEIVWKIDNKETTYADILEAVDSKKVCKELYVGCPDNAPYSCEIEMMDWELNWCIWIYRDVAKKKYGIKSYLHASTYDDFDEYDEIGGNEDFEGAYTGIAKNVRFDTIQEAFEMLPKVIDNFYNVIQGKGQFIRSVIDHYEE